MCKKGDGGIEGDTEMGNKSLSSRTLLSQPAVILCLLALTAFAAWVACDPPETVPVEISSQQSPTDDESTGPHVLQRVEPLMGTQFGIQLIAIDSAHGEAAMTAAFAEIVRVEELMSEYRESSEVSAVNRNAGLTQTVVGEDLFSVLEQALAVSEVTSGAFDITYASCGYLWSVRQQRIPADADIEACLPRVGFQQVTLDSEQFTILLPAEVRIGVGGIAKGYGVDRAAVVLESYGFDNYIVDGGGDIRLHGQRIDRPWVVGVAHPRESATLLGTLELNEGAVVSSGDYQRFFVHEGVQYHHIIDPATGRPARRAIAVTVIAQTATQADALSTGLFVLGPERGLEVAESLEGIEALIVDPDLGLHMTEGFREHFVPATSP